MISFVVSEAQRQREPDCRKKGMNMKTTTPATPADRFVMPPDGTSCGNRRDDGSMWFACMPPAIGKPGIAFCEHSGNWVNPPLYSLVAVFESEADRDFVLELHRRAVTA